MWSRTDKLTLAGVVIGGGSLVAAVIGLNQNPWIRDIFGVHETLAVKADPRPQGPEPSPSNPPSAPGEKKDSPPQQQQPEVVSPPVDRRTEFIHFINSGLRLSPTHPNVGLLIDSHAEAGSSSSNDIIQTVMGNPAGLNVVGNIADVRGLVAGGFFDNLYEGSSDLLRIAAQHSGVDYIIVMKAAASFHTDPSVAQSMIFCQLTVSARLYDKSGTRLNAASVTGAGPGFSRDRALERAVQHVSPQIQEQLLRSIPPRNGYAQDRVEWSGSVRGEC